jgi:hypothetical protein
VTPRGTSTSYRWPSSPLKVDKAAPLGKKTGPSAASLWHGASTGSIKAPQSWATPGQNSLANSAPAKPPLTKADYTAILRKPPPEPAPYRQQNYEDGDEDGNMPSLGELSADVDPGTILEALNRKD